jgi:3-oxoacyl-[acyl-carrier-protein] synthase-1
LPQVRLTFEQEIIGFVESNFVPRFSPLFIPKMISDIASGHVSIKFGFRGPNYGTVAACATASVALANAFDHIRLGRANVMVVGGSEGSVTRVGVGGFNAMHAISTRNDDPKTASRPFDADRDGFVIAGGGGMLVVEELEHAKARGAHIYAEIVGYGATSDGYDMVAPSGEGAIRCMQQAMATADGAIDYINAHGTSTPAGDIPELKAVKSTFGDNAPIVGSTKSLSGHSLGAAGVQEAIYSLLMQQAGFIAASANIENLDPEANGIPIALTRKDNVKLKRVMSNSFGFGGTNASLVFQSY